MSDPSPESVLEPSAAEPVVVSVMRDVESHRTTALCAAGSALIAGAVVVASQPWVIAAPWGDALRADAAHVAVFGFLLGAGYVTLHLGKCLAQRAA